MRLDKLIEAELGASRKEMKRLFLTGQVLVDGVKERSEGRNVDSALHEIQVAGGSLTTHEQYYLLNKPAGVVTANRDSAHQTVLDLLPDEDVSQLASVGRLDRDTEGLVFLTSNGQLAYELLHPEKKVTKVYEAWVNELVTAEDQAAFAEGITFIGGERCQPAELTVLQEDRERQWSYVRLGIKEGKFHQVKKMFLARGKKVVYLKRVALGPLRLTPELEVGDYRPLTLAELQGLRPYFK